METETKLCPFCAEIIKKDAIKCKHCGEYLKTANEPPVNEVKETEEMPKKVMSRLQLNTAFIITIISVILLFADHFVGEDNEYSLEISILAQLANIRVWFYFRQYLNYFNGEKAKNWINWNIVLNVIALLLLLIEKSNSGNEGFMLFVLICFVIIIVVDIFVSIKLGIALQKIKNDFVGLLKELGIIYTYLTPITFLLILCGIFVHNEGLRLVGDTLDALTSIILVAIFYKAPSKIWNR